MSKKIIFGFASSVFGDVFVASDNDVVLEFRFVVQGELEALKIKYKGSEFIKDDALAQSTSNKVFNGEPINYTLSGTPFQLSVWQELLKIPKGKTSTYVDISKAIGNPKASRAVGNAVGKNPLHYVVPCHRVIRKNGEIGGFAGGVEVKKRLLKKESSSL